MKFDTLPLTTDRFELRELEAADVGHRYFGWFGQDEMEFIANGPGSLEELAAYVAEKRASDNVLFLGIFDRSTGLHLGNIKYEPIDQKAGEAVLGILIGDPAWRRRGVASEVIKASTQYLRDHAGIERIILGVDKKNIPALNAYQKLGFSIGNSHLVSESSGINVMVLSLMDPPE